MKKAPDSQPLLHGHKLTLIISIFTFAKDTGQNIWGFQVPVRFIHCKYNTIFLGLQVHTWGNHGAKLGQSEGMPRH